MFFHWNCEKIEMKKFTISCEISVVLGAIISIFVDFVLLLEFKLIFGIFKISRNGSISKIHHKITSQTLLKCPKLLKSWPLCLFTIKNSREHKAQMNYIIST